MICKKCGSENLDNAKYCANCGDELETINEFISLIPTQTYPPENHSQMPSENHSQMPSENHSQMPVEVPPNADLPKKNAFNAFLVAAVLVIIGLLTAIIVALRIPVSTEPEEKVKFKERTEETKNIEELSNEQSNKQGDSVVENDNSVVESPTEDEQGSSESVNEENQTEENQTEEETVDNPEGEVEDKPDDSANDESNAPQKPEDSKTRDDNKKPDTSKDTKDSEKTKQVDTPKVQEEQVVYEEQTVYEEQMVYEEQKMYENQSSYKDYNNTVTENGKGSSEQYVPETVRDDEESKPTVNQNVPEEPEEVVEPAHVHQFTAWTETSTSCDSEGEKTRTCTTCGYTQTERTGSVGHQWSAWTTKTEPTCSTTGEKIRTCSVCTQSDVEEIPATEEHDYGDPVVGENFKIYTCKNCHQGYNETF